MKRFMPSFYFGKDEFEKYGDYVYNRLKGRAISKSVEDSKSVCGLEFEADILGMDMWDLLATLEGLCYNGMAVEVNDHTYYVGDSNDVSEILSAYEIDPSIDPHDWYFGKEAYDEFHDLVRDNLSGMKISKRVALAEDPGGLIYEADKLGLDKFELLRCLEGMCYNGEAAEIDDSTYEVF